MDEFELMDGDVTIRVTHSTVNYKDGLALSGKSPVIRRFPMVLGVDLAGIVESSRRSDFAPGDEVVLTGYGLSETHFGGYAERARVNGDWLVKLPTGLTRAEAMAIGTAGFTAMLALMAIERHDLTPSSGAALVTGAAGGVGSMAISLFADKGWRVIASTGRASEAAYLKTLGADEIIDRATLSAPGQAARQGAMGGRGRQRRLDDARQCARADPLRRRGRRLRACRPAWTCPQRSRRSSCAASRSSGSTASIARGAPARGLAAPGARSRPRQARDDDRDHPPGRGVRGRRPHPQGRDPGAAGGDDPLSARRVGYNLGARMRFQ